MIKYVKGDATNVQVTSGLRILVHIVNNKNIWGAGFVVALSRCWSEPENAYRRWATLGNNFKLGQVQIVPVWDSYGKLFVANMVAQDGFVGYNRPRSVDYEALDECLKQLNEWSKSYLYVKGLIWNKCRNEIPKVSIHMPKMIGCGLGGGEESVITEIIEKNIGHYEILAYELIK